MTSFSIPARSVLPVFFSCWLTSARTESPKLRFPRSLRKRGRDGGHNSFVSQFLHEQVNWASSIIKLATPCRFTVHFSTSFSTISTSGRNRGETYGFANATTLGFAISLTFSCRIPRDGPLCRTCRRLCSLSSKSTRRDPVLCFVSSSSPCRSNKLRAWSRGATHMQQPGGVSDLASSFRFP